MSPPLPIPGAPLAPTVVPRLAQAGTLELAARRTVQGLYAGRHGSPYAGPAVEFHDHRPYLPGDDLRSVDWKAFARSDHLLIRRHREERDLPLVLVLDTSASMDYRGGETGPTKREWALLAAAALALLAFDQGDRVRMAYGASSLDGLGPERGGAAGLAPLLTELGGLRWSGAGDLPRLLGTLGGQLRRRALVIVLSDLLGDVHAFSRALGALAARGHDLAAVQVLDPSELSLPEAWGRSRLSDPENVAPAVDCDSAAAKTTYDAAMRVHLAACRRAAAASRADHLLADTARPVGEVLGAWLHARGRR